MYAARKVLVRLARNDPAAFTSIEDLPTDVVRGQSW